MRWRGLLALASWVAVGVGCNAILDNAEHALAEQPIDATARDDVTSDATTDSQDDGARHDAGDATTIDTTRPDAGLDSTTDSMGDTPAHPPGTVDAEASAPDVNVPTCTAGGICAPNECQHGSWACVDGGPVCQEIGPFDAGTPCNAGDAGAHVCSGGQCLACNAGGDCSEAGSPCVKRSYDCSSGTAQCTVATNTADGVPCVDAGLYCNGGICGACQVNASCPPAANPCHVGKVTACSASGVATCTDQLTNASAGTSCTAAGSSSGVCDGAGSCVACSAGSQCNPNGNPCQVGVQSCSPGPQCMSPSNVREGQTCGAGQICRTGACVACNGASCPGCCDGNGCVTTSQSANECGADGGTCTMCPAPTAGSGIGACNSDQCGLSCTGSTTTQCASACVDPSKDPNCGGCGHSCATSGPGTVCGGATGQCVCNAASGCAGCCSSATACELYAAENTGSCGAAGGACHGCGTNMVCDTTSGSATIGNCICNSSFPNNCSGTCVNFANDNSHCGTCSNACAASSGTHCVAGHCVCDSRSCTGCCNGTLACEPFATQSNGSCGTGGATCAACAAGIACNTSAGLCVGCTGPTQISETSTGFTPAANDGFGASVAVSGNLALVGAPGAGAGAGAAYAFSGSGSTWTFQSQLFAAATTTSYGSAVAMSGATAMVAGQANGTTPTVYVFTQVGTGWFLQTSLTPNTSGSEIFGNELAMDGNTVVVGGLASTSVYTGSGASWTLQGALTPSDFVPSTSFFFGTSVAVNGDTAVLEAEPTDASGQSAHWLYVFTRSGSTWSQQGPKLVPSGLADNNNPHFNFTLGVSGNTIVLATNTNGAYIFTRAAGTWTQTQVISPGSDATFGSAVAVSANRAMIGSASFSGGTGLVYLFGQSNGVWIAGPQYSDTTGFGTVFGDAYGAPIAVSGTASIVGAPGTSFGAASGAGAAYIYSCSP